MGKYEIGFDVKEVLQERGIDFIDKGNWIHLKCLFLDHDDQNPSMSINTEHGGYNCFGCNRTGTTLDLFRELGWNEVEDSLIFVNPIYKSDFASSLDLFRTKKIQEAIFKFPKGSKRISRNIRHYEYMVDRGLEECIDEFDVRYTSELDEVYGKMYLNRIIIPVHNGNGVYIWPEGRAIIKDRIKYYRPGGVKKESYLFNQHRVKTDWVILVEGVIDVMTLWKWNYPVVCSFGAKVSLKQLSILLKNWDKIYLCFDIDKAGIEGFVDFRDKCRGLGVEVWRIKLPRYYDANSLFKPEFDKYFGLAKKIF
jgi:DNA primase